jgi:hypothetical protein
LIASFFWSSGCVPEAISDISLLIANATYAAISTGEHKIRAREIALTFLGTEISDERRTTMRYFKPEILTISCALETIKGSQPKLITTADHEQTGTVAAYEADE